MYRRRDIPFTILFVGGVVSALAWLTLGLLPVIAAESPTFHGWLHDVGTGTGISAEIARNAAQVSHAVAGTGQVVVDYLFSFFNIALAMVLIRVRPHDRTARLLSLGMIGSAIAFNLQGHDALPVIPIAWLSLVENWHVSVHVLSGLSYMFAMLMFPGGRLLFTRPSIAFLQVVFLGFIALFFTGLSVFTADDHTTGLVVVYGIFIPVVGVVAQIIRNRRARNEEEKQQSRVLLWALASAGLITIPLMIVTNSFGEAEKSETVDYELAIEETGTFFFRCDPHPEDMVGTLHVASGGPDTIELAAVRSRFDSERLEMGAGEPVTIRFTSFDSDLHNVAVYRDATMTDPVFIGKEFSGRQGNVVAFRIFRVIFIVIPIALVIGLIRFRLWDVNRVINRTLLYGILATFITATYLVAVVTTGAVIGGRINVFVSIVLTAIVAMLFRPATDAARRIANRLVYGKHAEPYEVLSGFSRRLGGTYDLQELLPQLARTIAEGTAATNAEVWLRVDDQLIRSAAWPLEAAPGPNRLLLNGDELPDFPERDRVVAVRHGDELLGAIAIAKAIGEEVSPVEDHLLEDAASQAGLALKNAQLTAELQTRLDELAASRRRIVEAGDVERRRLERDIHDGAQQHLVALSMKLRRAQDLSEKDPVQAQALLEELQTDTGDTLRSLRDLARGIYPPVLTDRGLAVALEAHARRCPIPVEVNARDVGRYPSNIEAAVYLCCSEAIQNAVKHSGTEAISVEMTESSGELLFAISDTGRGFEPQGVAASGLENMADRLAAVKGKLLVRSAPGKGTTITGRVPIK
jgi:signal transduction histidine kinase/plastocyanin